MGRLRALLIAFGVGLCAPIATGLIIAVMISLAFSSVYVFQLGTPGNEAERAQGLVAAIQAAAPYLDAAVLYALALPIGRRTTSHPYHSAVAMILGNAPVGAFIGASFGDAPGAQAALYSLASAFAAVIGVRSGFEATRRNAALEGSIGALRRARREQDIVGGVFDYFREMGVSGVTLYQLAEGRWLKVRVWAPLGEAGSKAAPAVQEPLDAENEPEFRQCLETGEPAVSRLSSGSARWGLWILLDGDGEQQGAIRLESQHRGIFGVRNRSMWRTLGAQVVLALANLRLLVRVREAGSREERERVSADIHDSLAQHIISSVVHLEAAQQHRADLESRERHTHQALAAARDALRQARVLVAGTHEAPQKEPLDVALRGAIAEFQSRSGIPVRWSLSGEPIGLGPDAERLLLRALREGLTNARKHGQATEIYSTLSYMEDAVALDLTDNGCGASDSPGFPELTGLGFGLPTLRKDAAALGGEVTFESEAGQGATLSVHVPAPIGASLPPGRAS